MRLVGTAEPEGSEDDELEGEPTEPTEPTDEGSEEDAPEPPA